MAQGRREGGRSQRALENQVWGGNQLDVVGAQAHAYPQPLLSRHRKLGEGIPVSCKSEKKAPSRDLSERCVHRPAPLSTWLPCAAAAQH